MSISDVFKQFIGDLTVDNADDIAYRYGQITRALNKQFRDTDSTTANTLQVGSYGRDVSPIVHPPATGIVV